MESVNDLLRDEAIRHQVALQGLSNNVVARIIATLNRSDKRILAELAEKLASMDATTFSMERLESLLTSIRSMSVQAYAEIERELTKELRTFVAYETSYQAQVLATHVPVGVHVASVAPDAAYTAAMSRPFQGVLLREVWKEMDASKMRKVRQAIASGFVEGKTTDQILRELRGTKARGYADGLLEVSRRDAEAVTRTALGHMARFAQDKTVEANAELIKALVWSATLDLRTTATCFVESTPVLPIGSLHGVSKRPFKGEVFVITTASGKQIRSTGNHPILTARGWRAAKEIEPRKDVLCRVVTNVGGIESDEDVEMQSTIGALADALGEPSVADVFANRASEADFHGDGMRGDYEVYAPAVIGSDLSRKLDAIGREDVGKSLLTGIQLGGLFSALGGEAALLERFCNPSFSIMPPEADAPAMEPSIKSAPLNVEFGHDLDWAHAGLKGGDDLSFIGSLPGLATPQGEHDAFVLEDSSNGGSCDAVISSNACGGVAVRILADDVVSVERELFSGHVFNLQTSAEFYIAGGVIVHNCRVRDGKQYTASHRPIGHKLPWLGGPGAAHWRCRSHATYVLNSHKELGIDVPEIVVVGRTRASMDGQLPAETTYADWLKRQSVARQDEVLGPTRGKLLRDGKLPLERMYSQSGKYLTIDQLKEQDAAAFKRAGL